MAKKRTPKPDGRRQARVERVVRRMACQPPSPTDPQGSYTGQPLDPMEKPVQDADDL